MCGIASVVCERGAVDPETVVRMRDAITHRGPDEAGFWISPDRRVAFGHRRLSIIDLDHGAQPMASDDGLVVLSYNGEIYNHAALRERLVERGCSFHTRCDTEVLLRAYETFGEDCLDQLDGMFAFTLWDTRRELLFFARDRVGKKPLYYVPTRTGWALASEIKALLAHPDVPRRVDTDALAQYLSFLVSPAPETLFAGISKLPAGHCGTWAPDRGLTTRQWWSPPSGDRLDVSADEAARRVRELLTAAVEKRMMSDVPFGAYLSGGIDSSANVALMTQFTDEPLHTLSIAYTDEPSLNELAHARSVADWFGTVHHEIVINDDDVLACLPELVHHQDEPLADPVCVPLFHLARFTKEAGITVVQVGEGSDEIFFGYPVYTQVLEGVARLRQAQRLVPGPLLRTAVRLAPGDSPRGELIAEIVRFGVPSARRIPGFSEAEKRRLLTQREVGETGYERLRAVTGSATTDEEIAQATLLHEFGLRLPELLLMRVDKMTMASSVEARAPFLDRDLVAFVTRLPLPLRWSAGSGKLVLKAAVQDLLPEHVLTRQKQGFGAPVWRWATRFRGLVERELLREELADYLNLDEVRVWLDAPESRRQGFAIWILLNFALWHRHWIEGDDLRELPALDAAGAR